MEDVVKQESGKNWIELEFDLDKKIVCTENHLFLTTNRGWVRAKELESEDEVVNSL